MNTTLTNLGEQEPCDSVGQTGLVQHNTKKGPWQRSAQLEDPYLRVEMISKGKLSKLDWILPRACKSEEILDGKKVINCLLDTHPVTVMARLLAKGGLCC